MGAVLKAWTPKEDEAVRSMVIAGRRPEEIAVKLRRPLGAIRARASYLRIYRSSGSASIHGRSNGISRSPVRRTAPFLGWGNPLARDLRFAGTSAWLRRRRAKLEHRRIPNAYLHFCFSCH